MTHITLDHVRRRLAARNPTRADATGRSQAAVAIVLVPDSEDGIRVLFIKRAIAAGDPWSGQMGFPGGRREAGDAHLLETAIRETAEETGVILSTGELIGELDDLAPMTPTLPPIVVRPFVFGLGERPTIEPSAEVQDYLWAPLVLLPAWAVEAEVVVRGVALHVPAYRVDDELVWGMTHRILRGLLGLVLT